MSQDLLTSGPLLAIEAALQARLRQGFPERLASGRQGFDLQLVPADFSLNEFRRYLHNTPAVLFGWTGVTPDPDAGAWIKGRDNWTIYLITKSSAGPVGRFRGDTLAPGLFGMIQVAMVLLQGFTVPDTGSVEIIGVTSMYAEGWGDDGGAIAAIQIAVPFTLWPAPEGGAGLDEFLRLSCSWHFGAPDETPPDAADVIAVRGTPA